MSAEHRVPAIDRAVSILEALGRFRDGLSLAGLAAECGLARSTVYRIVNSLSAANVVRRAPDTDNYILGIRLLGLAASMRKGFHRLDLALIGHDRIACLAAETGESSKISVLDGDAALCIDAVVGMGAYALMPLVGERFPLHAGAASKILLAAMDSDARKSVLAGALARHSERTVVDPAALRRELRRVARDGWAEDRGEYRTAARALAGPVHDRTGRVIAAVSLVYLADKHDQAAAAYRKAMLACCASITAELARLDVDA
ncbi:IclR family transcriptional regulator [Marinivivus vitaminiproducens]|uniref:IclR family transcriptional regulator n=1 Tax=Marinivivus vitaminiproducens TaxID=3035935 RepID=UPI00279B76AC|nr:IclR family transcriptional regulator [Geminicoccaceae bacterium SCSIO 64248]